MKVKLKEEDFEFLTAYISKGIRSVRKVKRAKIFLALHEGMTYKQAAQRAEVCVATVVNLVRRYKQVSCDVKQALEEAPRPGAVPILVPVVEAHITALACSEPPEGYGKWSLRLLRDEAVRLEYVPQGTSYETIRTCLKKVNISLGKASSGVLAK